MDETKVKKDEMEVKKVKAPRKVKEKVEKVEKVSAAVEPAKVRKGRFEKNSDSAKAYMAQLRAKRKPKDKKDEPKII